MKTISKVYNDRKFFDDLMRTEGKTVEVLEQSGMIFDTHDIVITLTKQDNGSVYYNIEDETGKVKHPRDLPVNSKDIYWEMLKEIEL